MTFEKKILRNIFRPMVEDNQRTTRTNIELEKLNKDANIDTLFELQRLRWMGRLQRTGQETARKFTKPTYDKNDPRGEPRLDGKVM
jgi:hypothetical protein